ncbi:Late embryogenesis abundant protein [Carex littledalei]|uniref:Late embryogenesis abundant protein n=1 Tax=Carex littledalei TaxID=544730 RepID=A0A833VC01_9POAL|nr:Late embryogenesis abundant protein [Carex littledalei]
MDYPSTKSRSGRPRSCFICCGVFVVLIIIAVAVLTALFLTVYKVRDPTMRINSLAVEDPSSGGSLLPTNMKATTNASVKNPNILALHYQKPNITAYYHDQLVGQADAPPGVAPAHGTVSMKAKLNLNITKLLDDPRFVDEFMKGSIDLNTTALVGGKVEILSVSYSTMLM